MQTNYNLKLLTAKTSYKLVICAALLPIADFLFYGQPAGWTLGLFGLSLLLAVLGCNQTIAHRRVVDIASYATLGLTFALMEAPSALAWCMFCFSIIALTLAPKLARAEDARSVVKSVLRYALTGWWRLYRDNLIISHIKKRRQKLHGNKRAFVRHWLLPIGLSAVFIMLFSAANPIITGWLDKINWRVIAEYISVPRMLFWLMTASGCWALIRPKLKQRKAAKKYDYIPKHDFSLTALLFNERSILTSLVLFNSLFFIQNMLDVAFLWSGAALPNGMTHAQYAHQGAYPLIVTVLLAAIFVLIALKPNSATERMPAIRGLVYAWVGQNIFLVISSITRLMGYIEEYSLTYLRVIALIWMALVAMGLILIITRIHLQKSNGWLININSASLYATLYLCCFVNFGGIIADYNIKHSREVTGSGANLDTYYLQTEIGAQAIPALLWFEQHHPDNARVQDVRTLRQSLEAQVSNSMKDWRQWTFRDFRLSHSLQSAN